MTKKKAQIITFSILMPIIVILVIVLLPEKGRFKIIDDYSRVISQVATVIGVCGVFYAIKSFKKSESDSKQKERSELMENSIKVLDIFSSKLIPDMGTFDNKSEKKYKELIEVFLNKAREDNQNINKLPKELKIKLKDAAKSMVGIVGIFNRLEQVCAYISYNLIIEDVVYPTIHKLFLDFLDDNNKLLIDVTTLDTPYKNIHSVRKKWKKISQTEELERKQEELNSERAILSKKWYHIVKFSLSNRRTSVCLKKC